MNIRQINKKKLAIGLISGTSFDGIDVALVEFKGKSLTPHFIDGIVYDYPKPVKEKIRQIISFNKRNNLNPVKEISQLNFLIGELFANAALKIIRKNNLKSSDISFISSHGQTIYHHPESENIAGFKVHSTFQIGESSIIAAKPRIKTISNFRELDIAYEGQGAPLVPFLDYVIFNKSKNIKGVLNIGGISNITIVGKSIKPIAFDIGPGNALIDLVVRKHFNLDLDKDGKLAESGKVDFKAINKAIKDPYFKKPPPKSTGKEYFNNVFLKRYFQHIKNPSDIIATVTYFTYFTIQKALKLLPSTYKVNELVISGGGVKNRTIIKYLQALLPNLKITYTDEYGLPIKYKEAILLALLGYTCILGIPNNIPSCTGAKKKAVLGKITFV